MCAQMCPQTSFIHSNTCPPFDLIIVFDVLTDSPSIQLHHVSREIKIKQIRSLLFM